MGEPGAVEDRSKANRPAAASKLEPGLWVVATPIGNLGDLSPRAANVLNGADLVVCEDSRVTGGLLHRLGIEARLAVYNDHNAAEVRPRLLARLASGEALALVSDAGTPCISDPGYKLVREAASAGFAVRSVPGPSAVVAALSIAGLPTDRFLFAGFLPPRSKARREALHELAPTKATLVLFEGAGRLVDLLGDAIEILGDRAAAVIRELSKLYEEARRGTLTQLAEHYQSAGPPKGEIVLVIGPPKADQPTLSSAEVDAALREELVEHRPRKAAALVAAATGLSANDLYKRIIEIRSRADDGR